MKKKLPPRFIVFLGLIFLVQLFIFTLFRSVFLYLNYDKAEGSHQLADAILLGLQFDSLLTSYTVLPAFLFLWTAHFAGMERAWHFRMWNVIFLAVSIISLLICCADIPYFRFFSSRLTSSVHMWMDNPGEMLSFVFSDPQFYPFILTFLFSSAALVFTMTRFRKKYFIEKPGNRPAGVKVGYFLLFAVLIFFGIRGNFKLRPLSLREAFFSNNAFINQLSINPVHSYLDSYKSFKIGVIPDEQALENSGKFLNAGGFSEFPIARKVTFDSLPVKKNVVVVLMESMTADVMKYSGNHKNLTPFLDSLSKNSLFFSNAYTAGIHTCNGVYGTLYSFPSLMAEHPMANVTASTQKFSGLPVTLAENGYETFFFCTHEEEFDNMGFFLRNNGIKNLFGKKDYPADKVVNNWGISDEYLFEFSLDKINKAAQKGNPFLSVILTISTHPPQEIPRNTKFKPTARGNFDQVYEYSDWALKNFFAEAARQPWYRNTLFVLMGDHGVNMNHSKSDAPLSLNHSPLIIFDPEGKIPVKTISTPALQIDIFPTIMGFLRIPYVNNTLGIDLARQSRDYAYFSQDTRLCVIGEGKYFVSRKNGSESLYDLSDPQQKDVISPDGANASKFRIHGYSMLQTAQFVTDRKKASPLKP